MSKYLKTKEGSLESAVLEAMSPAQQAAIAISKKEKEKTENNFIHAAKMAKEKGEKTFTIGGKEYDVEETIKTEKLVGGQKKLDKDGDGDIDGKDFAAMRKKAKKEETVVEKVEYVEYKFKSERDARAAKKMLDAVQLMDFDINDDDISNGELVVAGGTDGDEDFTKYHKEILKKFRQVKILAQEKNEEVKLQEKPADYLELEFNSSRDAAKAYDYINNKLYTGGHQPFNMQPNEGSSLQFEDMDDADKVMAELKKARFKFKVYERESVQEGFSPKQIKMAIGVASDKRYAGGNMTGAVAAIDKIKKGLSDHPQVAAVLKRQNESLAEKAARHITDMWKESASAKDKKENKKVKEEEEDDQQTMTGKPAAKIEVNPKSKSEK